MTIRECKRLYDRIYSVFSQQQSDYDTGVKLYNAVLHSPCGDVVEVGSAFGGSTIFLVGASRVVHKKVISIDPYPEGDYQYSHLTPIWKKFFENNFLKYYDNVVQYNTDITECKDRLPSKISVAFIDGLHEEESAAREFKILTDRMVDGGVLILDDTHLPELQVVASWIREPQFERVETVGITHAKFGRIVKGSGDQDDRNN